MPFPWLGLPPPVCTIGALDEAVSNALPVLTVHDGIFPGEVACGAAFLHYGTTNSWGGVALYCGATLCIRRC